VALLLALISACAHDDARSDVEERAADFRSAIATCPPGRTALTVAAAKARHWATDERLVVKGRLQVISLAVCTMKGCPPRACSNMCSRNADVLWDLQNEQGDVLRLRGWPMAGGYSGPALNLARRDLDVVVEATIVEPGALPDGTSAALPELFPHATSLCRRR
jgi:hypothetical protein